MMTEFGGAVAVPIAVRSSDSTTTIRVNDVIMTRIDGAIESTVNSAIIWIARSVTPPLPPPRLMLMSCACAGAASDPAAISVATNKTLRGIGDRLTMKTRTSVGQAGRPSHLPGSQSCSSAKAQERAVPSPAPYPAPRGCWCGPWSRYSLGAARGPGLRAGVAERFGAEVEGLGCDACQRIVAPVHHDRRGAAQLVCESGPRRTRRRVGHLRRSAIVG